jgi:hypothetical protein
MQHPVSTLPPASADTARRECTAAQSHKRTVAFRRERLLQTDRPWLTISRPHDAQIATGVHEHRAQRSERERDVIDRPTFRYASQVQGEITWEID